MARLRETLSTLIGALLIALVTKTFAFASYSIPTESMVPTLAVGDRIAVTPFSYGFSRYSVPFLGAYLPSLPTASGRVAFTLPQRGDIAVFAHPVSGEAWVKRVIGFPGDRIAVKQGELFINGVKVPREAAGAFRLRDSSGAVVGVTVYNEHLPDGVDHRIYQRDHRWSMADMAERVVPEGHLFMMGDNRDNSLDSRFAELGPVPFENLLGKTQAVVWSLSSCEPETGLTCEPRHWLQAVR